jgi:carbohydrate-selective porin OprB
MVGLQWADAVIKGNAFGIGLGDNNTDVNQFGLEVWYKFQVTDNISVTPALYYLSAPLGQLQKGNGDFNNFGGLVKTTFKF